MFDGSDGFALTGTTVGAQAGAAVALGTFDVNNDGVDDLLVAEPGAHQAFLLFGMSSDGTEALSVSASVPLPTSLPSQVPTTHTRAPTSSPKPTGGFPTSRPTKAPTPRPTPMPTGGFPTPMPTGSMPTPRPTSMPTTMFSYVSVGYVKATIRISNMTSADFGELEEEAIQYAVYDILSSYITSPAKVTGVTATDVNSIDVTFYLAIDDPAGVADSQLALVEEIYDVLNTNVNQLKQQLAYWMNEFGADESLPDLEESYFPLSAEAHYFSDSNTNSPSPKPTVPMPSNLPTKSTATGTDDVSGGGSDDAAGSGGDGTAPGDVTSAPVSDNGPITTSSSSKSSDEADTAATASWVAAVVVALLLCMVVVYMYQNKLYCFKEADESPESPVVGGNGDDIAVEADSVQTQSAAMDEATVASSNDTSMVEAPASMVTDVQEKIIEADL
mmetsp:Transcript_6925/g.20304  ORF Transcript_6925/g.20304 Transcript_6925/m.20304 type:complete len:444 (+) Transcript_6925:181-1512(+)